MYPVVSRVLKRWIVKLLVAAVVSAQATLAFSACLLDRSSLSRAMGSPMAAPCESETRIVTDWTKFPNRCFIHCTADLQTVGAAVALVRGAASDPVLTLPRLEARVAVRVGLAASPPGEPPPRILLHSFLI
jgi:hypothetical protein